MKLKMRWKDVPLQSENSTNTAVSLPACFCFPSKQVSHLLARRRDISRGLDNPLPAIMMFVEFLPESLKHGHERGSGGGALSIHLGVLALGAHLLINSCRTRRSGLCHCALPCTASDVVAAGCRAWRFAVAWRWCLRDLAHFSRPGAASPLHECRYIREDSSQLLSRGGLKVYDRHEYKRERRTTAYTTSSRSVGSRKNAGPDRGFELAYMYHVWPFEGNAAIIKHNDALTAQAS